MGNPNWKPALLGLVANSIAEEYDKSVFLWGRDGGDILKGSCRSNGTVNLVNMMKIAKDTFIEYGGHSYAGGFSITTKNVHTLEQTLNSLYKKAVANYDNDSELIHIDKTLEIDDVNWNTYKTIEQLAPYGIGNPKPLFLFNDIEVYRVSHFGKEKNHLKFEFKKAMAKSFPQLHSSKLVKVLIQT